MKKVIIIGATSGMGMELAKLYASSNCLVGITGRRKDLLNTLQQQFPDNILTECFDVTGNENIEHLKNLLQQLGGMDLLIYNSGYGDTSKNLDWEIDRQTTLTNVNGFVEIVNFAFNYFTKQGQGQIAGTSSIAAIRGNSWAPAYSASKAYMSNYLEGLQIKAARMNQKVFITDIQPGFVKTKMAKGKGQFWVAPAEKAAKQIFTAIKNKKRRVYITKRWWLIAKIVKWMPFWMYKKFG